MEVKEPCNQDQDNLSKKQCSNYCSGHGQETAAAITKGSLSLVDIGQSLPFSADGQEAINRKIEIPEELDVPIDEEALSEEDLVEQFELKRCYQWIKENDYQRVCLQLADNLLKFSTRILFHLESKLGEAKSRQRLYVLADSTYGSCCIDEKTAKHINGDSLIHFGHSCLTETNTNSIPVLYVFTKPKLGTESLSKMVETFQTHFIANTVENEQVLIFYDVIYEQVAHEFYSRLYESSKARAILSKLVLPGTRSSKAKVHQETGQGDPDSNHSIVLYGREFPNSTHLAKYIFYIGSNSRTILNLALASSALSSLPFTIYNPKTTEITSQQQQLTKLLMKRTYYIEKLKDCNSIGILIGTLAVENYLEIIKYLKELLKNVGKKVYIISIGEITPPKLANFPDIQIFVLISCPECMILDSKEFYQPIVTPYEVELAFNQNRNWATSIVNDFRLLLPGGTDYVPLKLDDEERPDMSLITGEARKGINSQLESIYWKGLNINEESPQNDSSVVVEGLSGTPRNYISEPKT